VVQPEDARCAIAAGANLIGVIFAKSKRKASPEQAAAVVEEPPKRSSRAKKEELAPAPAPAKKAAAKGKGKAAAPAAAPAKKAAAKKEPAAAKKAPAKKGAKVDVDAELFVEKLLDACKVLMTVCEVVVAEDDDDYFIQTVESFAEHGKELLELLPKDARLPMMKMASRYQEAIDSGPPFGMDELIEGEGEDGDDDDDDEEMFGDIFNAEHFYFFKQFFTPAEAKKFMDGADDASEAALTSAFADEEEEEEGEEEEEDDDDDEDDDEFDWMDPDTPWKGE